MAPSNQPEPDLLIDGYISHMFGPQDAEKYHATLLRRESSPIQWYTLPEFPGIFFAASPTESGSDQQPEGWAIDYLVKDTPGLVIRQQIWAPRKQADAHRYVHHEQLRPPIFFVHRDDNGLGLHLVQAAAGDCGRLRGADNVAGIASSTHAQIRINVSPI
jgi:hypothetical protein